MNILEIEKIIEKENYSIFPETPMQVLYYMANFPEHFLSCQADFPKSIGQVDFVKFSSYLTCTIKVKAIDQKNRERNLYFYSSYIEKGKGKFSHEVDIFWRPLCG